MSSNTCANPKISIPVGACHKSRTPTRSRRLAPTAIQPSIEEGLTCGRLRSGNIVGITLLL